MGGGGRGFGGGGRLGIGGIVVLVVLSLIFKKDLVSDAIGLGGGGAGEPPAAESRQRPPASSSVREDSLVGLMATVLDSAQTNWKRLIPTYTPAKLVLFRDEVRTACGGAESAAGPFY